MATKFEIEKFNGNKFSLWKLKIKAILRKDNCLLAIEGRPVGLADDKWKKMDDNAIANLHLALACQIVRGQVTSQQNIFKEKVVFSSNK